MPNVLLTPFRLTPPEPFASFRSANSLLKKAMYVP